MEGVITGGDSVCGDSLQCVVIHTVRLAIRMPQLMVRKIGAFVESGLIYVSHTVGSEASL